MAGHISHDFPSDPDYLYPASSTFLLDLGIESSYGRQHDEMKVTIDPSVQGRNPGAAVP